MTAHDQPSAADGTQPRDRRRSESWMSLLISVLLHAGIIAVLAMITWVVVREPEPPIVLELAGGGGGAAAGRDGSPAPAAAGAPAEQTAQAEKVSDAAAELAVPLPAPQLTAPDLSAAAMTQANAGSANIDPAMGLFGAAPGQGPGIGGGIGTGTGPGIGEGVGPGLDGVLQDMRRRGLDVVFVIDATVSMAHVIEQSKVRLRDIVSVVTNMVDANSPETVRFGLVAFKDYGDDYGINPTRSMPLTSDVKKLEEALRNVVAGGGADPPEPHDKALQAAQDRNMGWDRRRKNVIILITDAPVHSLNRRDAMAEARRFARVLNGTINVIDVGAFELTQQGRVRVRESVLEDLHNIAREGGGSAFLLEDEQAFWRHLIVSIFGQRYEQDVQQIIERYVSQKRPQ